MGDVREQLAALEHEQWAGWLKYLFGRAEQDSEGRVIIPASLVDRWKRQMATAYPDLPEAEKESDRVEADRVLNVLRSNNML